MELIGKNAKIIVQDKILYFEFGFAIQPPTLSLHIEKLNSMNFYFLNGDVFLNDNLIVYVLGGILLKDWVQFKEKLKTLQNSQLA